MANRHSEPNELAQGLIKRAKKFEEPVNIVEIYDAGPVFEGRYSIVTTLIDDETGRNRILVLGEDPCAVTTPETAEYLYKDYPLERHTTMRAAFEIFQVQLGARAHNEALKQ